MNHTDSPNVKIPPPLLYASVFVAAIFIQKAAPLSVSFFKSEAVKITGYFLIAISIITSVVCLRKFFLSKNTIITIKPASSLQTDGIYRFTRNPMYVGLMFLYLGLTCLLGNWYNLILLPLLVLIIQQYVIVREEKYLLRRFGAEYADYRSKVRRWL